MLTKIIILFLLSILTAFIGGPIGLLLGEYDRKKSKKND